MLVLERYEDAVARGAPIYGEIAGYGLTGDALPHDRAAIPSGTWAARAMQVALARGATRAATKSRLINAHGSSSPLNDKTETLAIERAFGDAAATIPVMATKGQHGHALGRDAARGKRRCRLLAMRDGRLPARRRTSRIDDPECDLDVRARARASAARAPSLSNTDRLRRHQRRAGRAKSLVQRRRGVETSAMRPDSDACRAVERCGKIATKRSGAARAVHALDGVSLRDPRAARWSR